ncbi:MAG: PAS domain S-box-containing protein [Sulfurimonas sp.]
MFKNINENLLLKIIKYAPSLFLILFAVLMTSYLFYQNKQDLNIQKSKIKVELIESKKDIAKNSLQMVHEYIHKTIENSENSLKKDLKNKIDIAWKITENIYNKNKDSLTKKEIILHIKNALESFRFKEERGYFSIHTMTGINILHPINKKFEGTSVLNRIDAQGNHPVQTALRIAKSKGEGFFSWYYYKPNDKSKQFEKFGIVKKFEPLNLIITTAEYIDDYKKNLNSAILEHLKIRESKENIFLIDSEGNSLLTTSKYFNISEVGKNNQFVNLFNDFVNSKKEDTYMEYKFIDDNKEYSKISYLTKVHDNGWIIGGGFDVDALNEKIINRQDKSEKEYERHIYVTLVIAIVMTTLLLIISIWVSKFSEKLFINYRKTLKRKNLILNKAQSQAKIGSWEKSFDSEILNCSDETYHIFEIDSKNNLTFKLFIETIYPEDIESLSLAFHKSVQEHTEYYFEHRLPFADGRVKYIVERGEHFYDKNNIYTSTIGTVQDFTERQNNLLLLEHKKEELETIIQNAPTPMMIHNEDGKILMLNEAWINSTGYSSEEISTIDDWVKIRYEDTQDKIDMYKRLELLCKITQKVDVEEYTFLNKNKDYITWKQSSAPLGIIEGKRTIISTAMDITELKQKDEMLINQSRHAAMGEMISMIAHQWRQPLSTISMDANNMLLDIALGDFSMSESEKYANNISEQTEHLSQTIDDFRNFFKPDKEISKVNIKDIYEKTLSIVQDSLRNHSIELKSTFETQTQVEAFARELMQVFVNIITNAKDALVSSEIETPMINVRVYEDDEYINIEISDNAGGIDAEILPKIFDPYFSTKGDLNGTGLGLYMSKVIIENHLNGTLDVKNNDEGACFTVSLPKEAINT